MDNCYPKPINNLSSNSRIPNPVTISVHEKMKGPMMGKHPSSTTAGGSSDRGATATSSGEHVPPSGKIVTSNLKSYTFSELRSATRDFSPDTMLGEVGFGRLFKGWVDSETYAPSKVGIGIAVVVKRFNCACKEFQAEIEFLGKFSRHPNVVNLLGYCMEDGEFLLVYEYMHNESVEPLTWCQRIKITLEAAKGLSYFHTTAKCRVIHIDFKPANILLDKDIRAKLSDFGCAKLGPHGDSRVLTDVGGTYAYAAPEYITATMRRHSLLRVLPSETATAPVRHTIWHGENTKDPYRLSFEDSRLAKENFRHELPNLHSDRLNTIAIKRLQRIHRQGDTEFYKELLLLCNYKNENVITLLGFCDETDEKIIVYEHALTRSLDKYMNDVNLTWNNRFKIYINLATELDNLHGRTHWPTSVIHRRIKAANILHFDDWKVKVGDLGLSMLSFISRDKGYVIDHVCGTRGYLDPLYLKSDLLPRESDIFSFGVVLFEILCGRPTYVINHPINRYLPSFIKHMFAEGKQNEVEAIKEESIKVFSNIAYQCLHDDDRKQRLPIKDLLFQLEKALEFQILKDDRDAFYEMHFASMRSVNHLENVYLNFRKRNWMKMSQLSFIDRDGDREGKDRDRGRERNDRERDSNCYAKPVNNLAGSATRKLGLDSMLGEGGLGKFEYMNFSKANWTEMTLLSFIGLILLAAPTCTATAGSWSGDPDDKGLISLADHKNIFHVVPGDVKNVWNEWVLRGLILISLISQIALSLLGSIRKYNWRTPVRMGLWFTCLLAYSVVPAALGMISQSNSEPTPPVAQPHRLNTSELMSFWAPFLFLHLGGPDSITAFALEDSKFYLRYFVEMVFLSLVALCILVGSWREYSYLSHLVIFVYLPGFIKCFERILALRLANTGYLRNSMLSSPDPGTNYHKLQDDLHLKKSQGSTVNLDEVSEPLLPSDNKGPGRVISDAYHLYQKFKRLFVDLIPTFEDRDGSQSYFRHLKSDDAFHIVEIELGFAFDMLYTKANVVYTSMGLALRLASLYFLLMVAVCFYILNDMDFNYSIDIVITHLLVGLAILMDIFSVITMLRSDWTDLWLSQRNLTRNILVLPFLKRPTKQRWSGTIGQFELLSVANEEKPETCFKIQKLFGMDFIGVKHHYKTYSKVSDNLKHLIFNHFRELMVNNFPPNELCSPKCSISLQKNGCDYLLWSAPTEVEFDQSILIWHIATAVCYYSELDNQDDGDIYVCRKESKIISDYLLYLLVEYPLMLPVGIGMVRYRDTCAEAMRFFKEKGPITAKVEACRKLLEVDCMEGLLWKVKGGQSKSALFDGCRLALTLKKMERERMWKVMSQVWIEILAYAATQCKGFHHKQQLGKGGEFLTHVWLLMAHLGITEQFQVSQGHARAKMNVR